MIGLIIEPMESGEPFFDADLSSESGNRMKPDERTLPLPDQHDNTYAEGHDVLVWVGLLGAAMFLLNAFIPVFSPILAGLCGVWLMLGRYNAWRRIVIVAVAVLVLGLGSAVFYLLLVAIVFVTAAMTFGMSLIMSVVTRTPYRGTQFSLAEVGGMIFIMALVCGALRLVFEQTTMFFFDADDALILVLQAIAVSANIVLGSLCVFVPERYRTARLFYLSAVSVLVVMPLLEILVAIGFGWRWKMAGLIMLMHWGGAPLVWLLLFPLELAGLFSVEVARDERRLVIEPPTQDPLG